MTRVVARILARDARCADPQRCARSGVEAVLPAALGLVRARSSVPAGDRNGLVHRRCRIRRRPDGAVPPAPRCAVRAGWELTAVVVHVDRWEVTHWLARHLERTGGGGAEGVGAGGPTAVSVTGRGDLADRRGTALRRTAAPADGGAGDADGS